MPTSSILTASALSICVLFVCRESGSGDSISHDCNLFNIMIQTNNVFIPTHTLPVLITCALRAVSLWCVSDKWAFEAKR